MCYISVMDSMKPIKEVAGIVGIDRNTLARWVAAGKVKGKRSMGKRLPVVLVSVAAVRKLVGDGISPGRPRLKK
jgi:predicted site-specific integrase-resolvase